MATPGRTKSFDDLEGALSSFRTKAAQDIGELWKHIEYWNVSKLMIPPAWLLCGVAAWNDINFGVKGKVILDNVWGHVSPTFAGVP